MPHVHPHLLNSECRVRCLLRCRPAAQKVCLRFQVVLTVKTVDLPKGQCGDCCIPADNRLNVIVLDLELALCQQRTPAPVIEVKVSVVADKVVSRCSRVPVGVHVGSCPYGYLSE